MCYSVVTAKENADFTSGTVTGQERSLFMKVFTNLSFLEKGRSTSRSVKGCTGRKPLW